MKKSSLLLFVIAIVVGIVACKKDDEETPITPVPETPSTAVSFDLSLVPYPTLADYKFFVGTMSNLDPNEDVLPYDVITPLFSDYAKKKRFIWMPEGTKATYNSDHTVLEFPEGTVMIKNFYYDHVQPSDSRKIIETRLIYKKNGEWKFADYIWNDEQTEATYSLQGSTKSIEWLDENGNAKSVNYRIPSEVECFTCHKTNNIATPIGPKPQNLNKNLTYADGSMNQLSKWIQVGYLENNLPGTINTVVDWTDETQSLENRVRAYVDMNCAHCHKEGSHCDYRPLRLAYNETLNPVNLGVCVDPQEEVNSTLTHIIARGNVNRSVMSYRLNTTEPQFRMPLLGRSLVHEEAVQLLNEYISSLSPACP